MKLLRYLRIVVASVFLIGITALFVAPTAIVCAYLGWLARVQLVPAIMAGQVIVLVVLAVLIAIFGRFYCSAVCPLGIAQDLVRWLARLVGIRKSARLAPETRTMRIVRWTILALFLIAVPLGLVGLLEPYGIFGRFLVSGFTMPSYLPVAVVMWSVSLCALILLAAAIWPRAWCNLVCPVGTLLGFVAWRSLLRVRIDQAKCVNCNLCVKACDHGCIPESKDKKINSSRCVLCLKCATSCPKGALIHRPDAFRFLGPE